MSNLVLYKKTFSFLYGKVSRLNQLIESLDAVTLTISKKDLLDLAIKQINQIKYSIEDQHSQIEAVSEFLDSEEVQCFKSPSVDQSFKVRLFTAKGMEKSVFLGTPLDWFNISEQLSGAPTVLAGINPDFNSAEELRMSVFDQELLEAAYLAKTLDLVNVLRTNLIAIKGYALYRVENVLSASGDFYVENLLNVCLQALPILKEMEQTCEIAGLPVEKYSFSFENTHLVNELPLKTLEQITA